jgi:hypothetical protein
MTGWSGASMCPEKLDQVHTILARRFYVEALLFVVGSIVGSRDHLRLKMTLTARANLPMLAAERPAHEAFGAGGLLAQKILHWKGDPPHFCAIEFHTVL